LALSEIGAETFARYRDQRLKTVTPGTLKRQLNPIRNMFEVAKTRWGLPIVDNPVAALVFKATDRKRDRRLRSNEHQRLMAAATAYRNPILMNIIKFAIATGMRRGEILSMQWTHLNLLTRTLTIPLSKNGHSRTIPLSLEAVNAIPEKHSEAKYVFPMKGNALRLAFDRVTRRAAIRDLRFHDLRHEAISRLFELGLTTPEIASISGHKDLTMLFRYAHAQNQNIIAKFDISSKERQPENQ
jgi:integrase